MIKLKNITDSSWLLVDLDKNKSAGLLSKNPNSEYFLIFADQTAVFKNKNEVENFFGDRIFSDIIETKIIDEKTSFVDGFPVKVATVFDVKEKSDKLPIYSKTEKSEVLFCAGYYCIQFDNGGWVQSFCPKHETLIKYKYEGPFKTKIQMRSQLSKLQKKERQNEKV